MKTKTKTCTKCGRTKPRASFHRNRWQRDGLHRWCKACASIRAATYYRQNKEKVLAYRAMYLRENKEKVRAYGIMYRSNNKEALRARWARYYRQNRRALLDRCIVWRIVNRDAFMAQRSRFLQGAPLAPKVVPPTKKCRMCGRNRPSQEFSPNRYIKDGLSSYCRSCASKRHAEWHRRNLTQAGTLQQIAEAVAYQRAWLKRWVNPDGTRKEAGRA